MEIPEIVTTRETAEAPEITTTREIVETPAIVTARMIKKIPLPTMIQRHQKLIIKDEKDFVK